MPDPNPIVQQKLISASELARRCDAPLSRVLRLIDAGKIRPDFLTSRGELLFLESSAIAVAVTVNEAQPLAKQLSAISDPADRTRFYRAHRAEIFAEKTELENPTAQVLNRKPKS